MNNFKIVKNNFGRIQGCYSQNLVSIFNTDVFYDKRSIIGKGSYGQVYKGYNKETESFVAVKVLQTNNDPNSFQFQSLLNQIQALKKINGQYILKYVTHSFDLKKCFIVTQLCNQTLNDKIEKLRNTFGDLSAEFIRQVLSLYQKIIKGVLQIHNSGYIHRDIKPLNIFIQNNGDPKIGDLGFCLKISQIKYANQWKIGSKPYISPQVLQFGQYSKNSDIWSIGISLYQSLFKEYPFYKKCLDNAKIETFYEELNILKQKFNKDKESPKMFFKCMIFEKIISKCLNVNSNKRISLQKLQQEIQSVLKELNNKRIQKTVQNHFQKFFDFSQKLNQILCKNDQKITTKLKNYLKQCLQNHANFSQEKILSLAKTCYKKMLLILKMIKNDKDAELYKNELQILYNLKKLIEALNEKQNLGKNLNFSYLNKVNNQLVEKLSIFSTIV